MEGRRPTMVRMARGAPQGGMVGRGHRACWLMRGMIRARKRAPLSIHCLFTVGQWGSPGVSLSGRYALPHHCARACVTGQVGIKGTSKTPTTTRAKWVPRLGLGGQPAALASTSKLLVRLVVRLEDLCARQWTTNPSHLSKQ